MLYQQLRKSRETQDTEKEDSNTKRVKGTLNILSEEGSMCDRWRRLPNLIEVGITVPRKDSLRNINWSRGYLDS